VTDGGFMLVFLIPFPVITTSLKIITSRHSRYPDHMYNSSCLQDLNQASFVAYTHYICVCYPNLGKLNGIIELQIVKKIMEHIEGTDISHSLHMVFVISDQLIQYNFPLPAVEPHGG
jgi:hypothetical protein